MTSNRFPNASTSPDGVERKSSNRKKQTQRLETNALAVKDADQVQTSAVTPGLKLTGGSGNDVLTGGNGDDVLLGVGGDDQLTGKGGKDRLEGGEGKDRLFGNQKNDRLFGDNGNDRLIGGNNADILQGGSGKDRLVGEDKSDRLNGGDGNDRLLGGNGKDTLRGGDGNDRISGGNGKDVIVGGFGEDRLTGGGDRDIFVYNSTSEGRDRIVDFDTDEDKIDLSSILNDGNYNSNNRLRDYITIVNDEDDTLIRVDPDGENGDRLFQTVARLVNTDYDDVGKGNFIGL